MKFKLAVISGIISVAMLGQNAMSLEIPLSGGGGGGASERIAFVDMERIFQIYPQTKAAKEDYLKKRDKMREDLTEKEFKLEEVKQKLAVLESTLISSPGSPEPAPSNEPPVADDQLDPLFDQKEKEKYQEEIKDKSPEAISKMKKDLETLEFEYKDARDRSEQDLIAFENRQTQIILGKIYNALQELAEEEQVDLIVDKSSILFGSASIDLTEKLQQRVRGF